MTGLMTDVLEDMLTTIEDATLRFASISEAESEKRREIGKWSTKEILGHLIDSATNNHARFVKAQLKDDLTFEGYEQEAWVATQQYHNESWPALVSLWTSYNRHLLHVIASIPDDRLKQRCREHSLNKIAWKVVDDKEPATLEYLIRDYVEHMKHHLRQVLND